MGVGGGGGGPDEREQAGAGKHEERKQAGAIQFGRIAGDAQVVAAESDSDVGWPELVVQVMRLVALESGRSVGTARGNPQARRPPYDKDDLRQRCRRAAAECGRPSRLS